MNFDPASFAIGLVAMLIVCLCVTVPVILHYRKSSPISPQDEVSGEIRPLVPVPGLDILGPPQTLTRSQVAVDSGSFRRFDIPYRKERGTPRVKLSIVFLHHWEVLPEIEDIPTGPSEPDEPPFPQPVEEFSGTVWDKGTETRVLQVMDLTPGEKIRGEIDGEVPVKILDCGWSGLQASVKLEIEPRRIADRGTFSIILMAGESREVIPAKLTVYGRSIDFTVPLGSTTCYGPKVIPSFDLRGTCQVVLSGRNKDLFSLEALSGERIEYIGRDHLPFRVLFHADGQPDESYAYANLVVSTNRHVLEVRLFGWVSSKVVQAQCRFVQRA